MLAGGATVPFPYHNPSLLADGAAPHSIAFTVPEAGPFALELVDRSGKDREAVRAWLFRTDGTPSMLTSFVMTWDLVADEVLDTVVYSRASLPAGDYALLVAPMDLNDPARTDLTRPFGLRLEAAERLGRAADADEPNDFPAEAPTVTLPHAPAGPGFETPYGMDHYAFEVADTTTVAITTSAPDAQVLTYVFPDSVTDILEAWETGQFLASAGGADSVQTASATLSPGRYTALVWDWGGRARAYELEMAASAPLMAAAGRTGTMAVRSPASDGPSQGPPSAGAAASALRLPPAAAALRAPWRPPSTHPGPRR